MIRCDHFSLDVAVERRESAQLVIQLVTDLPAGTLVNVDCTRVYLTLRDQPALWTLFDERLEIQPAFHGDFSGLERSIDVEAGDAEASAEFEEALGSFSSGIRTKVSDTVTVTATVGARQRLKAFGRNNENLRGSEVSQKGDLKIVQAVVEIDVPMREDQQPLDDG